MAKKVILESRSEPAFFTFIGIACHLMDYRLIYELNRTMEINFIKENDFIVSTGNGNSPATFSFYVFRDEDQRLSYYLVSNRSQNGALFPSLKQTDFMVVIEGILKKQKKESLLSQMRTVPKIIMAFELKPSELKQTESFLNDLELHVMKLSKKII